MMRNGKMVKIEIIERLYLLSVGPRGPVSYPSGKTRAIKEIEVHSVPGTGDIITVNGNERTVEKVVWSETMTSAKLVVK
jgi:CRISPR/Cas system type I-B associated protein Csh2 (Cas7 group RAMP superfamily)